ncbi:DNA polymerase III subunit alpha [Aureimonas fodinaquatilis]|uniref:Error-prone DNA polymerase n=2 Tax=Aureimonas fodinaquatilis TaxID=2565783 RepID=A0A5B0DTN6_9HYPH|nr:DNA polymerase III subunit alpha [Aureimonas fodinaquatilis]
MQKGFCEIGVSSAFSFLRGASSPSELVAAASALGLGGIGLADRNTVAGVVRAYQTARDTGMAFRPGARLVFADGTADILAYPRNRAGWGHLCRLLSLGNLRTKKGDCQLFLADLLQWGGDMQLALLCPDGLALPDWQTVARPVKVTLAALMNTFPGSVWLAGSVRHDGQDQRRLARAASLAAEVQVPFLATNDVYYHIQERRMLQDVVTAIREHVTLQEAGFLLARNAQRRLCATAEMDFLFREYPHAVDESRRFFAPLNFDLKSLHYEYPDEGLKLNRSPAEELFRLAREGAYWRYPNGVPDNIWREIDREMAIIIELQYEPYFLTVHRIMEAARRMNILCQGRGSAANSTICYCMGITAVPPEDGKTLFERFISPERGEPPDIDIDFEHERRDDIINWIYEEYGRENAAITATVISYRSRSAGREVGKVFGLSEDALSALSASVWGTSHSAPGEWEAQAAGLSTQDATTTNILHFASELAGFPRHLSQHVGGFVLTRGRVDEVVPIMNTGSKGRLIVEWDKDDLDELNILKIDILALGMLSCLHRSFDMLKQHYPEDFCGQELELGYFPKEPPDGPVWKMTHRADTLGVFQIESRAQMSMLPKLKPNEYYDLVIQVAIVRPGPIQGDMVHPYLKRRMAVEKVTYPKEELRAVLERTCGVPLFQEQAMQIAMVAAGFSGTKADGLRRAMATFKRTGEVGNFRDDMINGMLQNGYEQDFAERCFRQIEGFGEYGFPESHAASFAVLVYDSAWIKCHYPDVFAAALLNSQPLGFYAPAQIVRDAREHGVEVRPVCINSSQWDQTLEPTGFDATRIHRQHAEMAGAIRTSHAMRLGFRQVKGLSEAAMKLLVEERARRPFDSVREVWLRTGLPRATIARLADADAFHILGLGRRDALWAAEALDKQSAVEHLPLFVAMEADPVQDEPDAHLPPMPLGEEVVNDYRYLSLSLKAHPVSFLRPELVAQNVMPNSRLPQLPSGRRACVAGLVLIRQRPGSAKGVIFMTLEDETGIANVVVWPKTFEIFRAVVLGGRFLKVRGRVQSSHNVVHLVAEEIIDMTSMLGQLQQKGGRDSTPYRARNVGDGSRPVGVSVQNGR